MLADMPRPLSLILQQDTFILKLLVFVARAASAIAHHHFQFATLRACITGIDHNVENGAFQLIGSHSVVPQVSISNSIRQRSPSVLAHQFFHTVDQRSR